MNESSSPADAAAQPGAGSQARSLATSANARSLLLTAIAALGISAGAAAQSGGPPPRGGAPGGMGAQQNEAAPPVIDSVTYAGNTRFSSAELAKATALKAGMKVSKELVGNELDRVAALYKKAGIDARVSPNIAHPSEGHVTIAVNIVESNRGQTK